MAILWQTNSLRKKTGWENCRFSGEILIYVHPVWPKRNNLLGQIWFRRLWRAWRMRSKWESLPTYRRFTRQSGLQTTSRSDHTDFKMSVALCLHFFPFQKECVRVHSPTCAYCGSKLLCSLARKFQIFRIQCFVFYAFLSWLRSCEKCCAIVELSDLVPLVTIHYRVPWMRKKLLLF